MQLLNLNPSRVSLEFSLEEWPIVSRRLKRYGNIGTERFTSFDAMKFGSEEFLFVSDEDNLALISQSPLGDVMLRRIFEGIRARPSARQQRLSFRARPGTGFGRLRLTRQAA